MPPDAVTMRVAAVGDAATIADLHARSWRSAYRGSLSDAYLDGPIFGERQAFWTERLRHATPGVWTSLAERDGAPVGFVCALQDHDARWGTLIDNLHADPAAKRQGIGRAMLQTLGEHLASVATRTPVHLFVLDANRDAVAFYLRLGGESVEALVRTEPDGSRVPVTRIAWPDVASFRAAVA